MKEIKHKGYKYYDKDLQTKAMNHGAPYLKARLKNLLSCLLGRTTEVESLRSSGTLVQRPGPQCLKRTPRVFLLESLGRPAAEGPAGYISKMSERKAGARPFMDLKTRKRLIDKQCNDF